MWRCRRASGRGRSVRSAGARCVRQRPVAAVVSGAPAAAHRAKESANNSPTMPAPVTRSSVVVVLVVVILAVSNLSAVVGSYRDQITGLFICQSPQVRRPSAACAVSAAMAEVVAKAPAAVIRREDALCFSVKPLRIRRPSSFSASAYVARNLLAEAGRRVANCVSWPMVITDRTRSRRSRARRRRQGRRPSTAGTTNRDG